MAQEMKKAVLLLRLTFAVAFVGGGLIAYYSETLYWDIAYSPFSNMSSSVKAGGVKGTRTFLAAIVDSRCNGLATEAMLQRYIEKRVYFQ